MPGIVAGWTRSPPSSPSFTGGRRAILCRGGTRWIGPWHVRGVAGAGRIEAKVIMKRLSISFAVFFVLIVTALLGYGLYRHVEVRSLGADAVKRTQPVIDAMARYQ